MFLIEGLTKKAAGLQGYKVAGLQGYKFTRVRDYKLTLQPVTCNSQLKSIKY